MNGDLHQRFQVRQGLFGWKGFRKDPKWNTTIATVAFLINYLLLLYAVSELGGRTSSGGFRFDPSQKTLTFYVLAVLTLLSCTITGALIRCPDSKTRWGGRIVCCALPAAVILMTVFFWGQSSP